MPLHVMGTYLPCTYTSRSMVFENVRRTSTNLQLAWLQLMYTVVQLYKVRERVGEHGAWQNRTHPINVGRAEECDVCRLCFVASVYSTIYRHVNMCTTHTHIYDTHNAAGCKRRVSSTSELSLSCVVPLRGRGLLCDTVWQWRLGLLFVQLRNNCYAICWN